MKSLFVFFLVVGLCFSLSTAKAEETTDLQKAVDVYCHDNDVVLEVDIPKISFNITGGMWNKYILANNTVSLDKPIIWADFSVSVGDHFSFDIWESHDLHNSYSGSFGDETDLNFSWVDTFNLLDKEVTWKAGANYFLIFPHDTSKGDMVNLSVDFQVKDVWEKTGLYANFDRNEILEMNGDAWTIEGGLTRDWEIGGDFIFSTKAGVAWDSGTYGAEQGYNAVAAVGLKIPICEGWKPVVRFEYFLEMSRRDPQESDWRVGIDILSINF